MARRRAHAPLNVYLNGRLVGVLRREASGAIDFQYAPDMAGLGDTFPVSLSLPLREDRYIGAPVINVFDNLLPDSDAIRKRVAERVGADGTDAYSLLAALGHDCVGALQFLPDGIDPATPGAPTASRHRRRNRRHHQEPRPPPRSAWARTRISASRSRARRKRPRCCARTDSGSSRLGTTATTHILKPQIGQLPTASTSRTASRTNISA